MKRSLPALAMLLAACATLPPGEDEQGKEMKSRATPVLVGLSRYQHDKHEFPRSLHELVPRYVTEVPFDLALEYDRDRGIVAFSYRTAWPRDDAITCLSKPGQTTWKCLKAAE